MNCCSLYGPKSALYISVIVPVPDSEALPSFSAFFRPEVGTTASSVTLNLPGGENQDLSDVLGMFYTLSEDFDSAAQLEAAYLEAWSVY